MRDCVPSLNGTVDDGQMQRAPSLPHVCEFRMSRIARRRCVCVCVCVCLCVQRRTKGMLNANPIIDITFTHTQRSAIRRYPARSDAIRRDPARFDLNRRDPGLLIVGDLDATASGLFATRAQRGGTQPSHSIPPCHADTHTHIHAHTHVHTHSRTYTHTHVIRIHTYTRHRHNRITSRSI